MNNNITEIKYVKRNKRIYNSKQSEEKIDKTNNNINYNLNSINKKQNTKSIIMLNENKCCSQKNITSSKKLNIINSPIQYQNLNTHKRIPSQKEDYKTENIQNYKYISNNSSSIFLRGNKSPNSNFDKGEVGKY